MAHPDRYRKAPPGAKPSQITLDAMSFRTDLAQSPKPVLAMIGRGLNIDEAIQLLIFAREFVAAECAEMIEKENN